MSVPRSEVLGRGDCYRVFGLTLLSEVPLPELTPASDGDAVDLTITLRSDPKGEIADLEGDEPRISRSGNLVMLSFPGVARFTIDAPAHRIDVDATGGARELVSLPLLGPVMAVFLHLCGRLVLHASAVEIEGRALAFVGDKGAGKSTTATAFLRGGATLVTDDLLVCRREGHGRIACETGYAQLKLNADAAAAFPLSKGDLVARPHPAFSKDIVRVPAPRSSARPFMGICELQRGDGLSLTRLSPAEVLQLVLAQGYVARYGATFLSGPEGPPHLRRLAELATSVPFWRVQVPSSLAALEGCLPELVRALERGGEPC